MKPTVAGFFHEPTSTVSYIVADEDAGQCAVIDPVLDYEARAGRTATTFADTLIDHIAAREWSTVWILETHVHADHLSATPYLKERLGGKTVIGAHICIVQKTFGALFNAEKGFATDGSQFDALVGDGDTLKLGGLDIRVLSTPGHTPACVSYLIGDAVFVGDTLFMPDYGTARCDFPGGSAETLYASISRLLALPDDTRMFVGHDYQPGGRDAAWETTVGEQKAANTHIADGISRADFVAMRTERDGTLALPELILPSVQVNMRGGALPPCDSNGVHYLKIPINQV
jgi:glyoxylase-like metal-dependent hydrolase (beta-lactamase superfamily II)